eukprot:2656369-Rhodomonas_salina.3
MGIFVPGKMAQLRFYPRVLSQQVTWHPHYVNDYVIVYVIAWLYEQHGLCQQLTVTNTNSHLKVINLCRQTQAHRPDIANCGWRAGDRDAANCGCVGHCRSGTLDPRP